MTNDC